jgi:hypothetical protein
VREEEEEGRRTEHTVGHVELGLAVGELGLVVLVHVQSLFSVEVSHFSCSADNGGCKHPDDDVQILSDPRVGEREALLVLWERREVLEVGGKRHGELLNRANVQLELQIDESYGEK